MNERTIFITGVSGVGKTTVIDHLKPLLDENFELHDFDERGVPDNVDRQWRIEETKHWKELGTQNSEAGKVTIICGFARPSEIDNTESVKFILLDADEQIIKRRLLNRYQVPGSVEGLEKVVGKSLEQFIEDNVNFASVLREEAKEYGVAVIDTTESTPDQVAQEIADVINKS